LIKQVKRTNTGHFREKGRNYSRTRWIIEAILSALYAGGWAGRAWGLFPGSSTADITEYTVARAEFLGRIPFRLAFVSDLHIGPTTNARLLENAFSALEREKTDVVILGGDYVFLDASDREMTILGRLVRTLTAPLKLAVLGNHDIWTNRTAITRTLEACGVRVLVNESVRLPHPYGDVAVAGIDEPRAGIADAEEALAGTLDATMRISVCHSPNGAFDVLAKTDLFLAGHTHGGQIAFPGGLPIILPKGKGCRKWSYGSYRCRGTMIIVSRGVGCTELPIRMFAKPEIVVIELTPPGPIRTIGRS
jgi:predicted MPP superfamily phosphohydrolase